MANLPQSISTDKPLGSVGRRLASVRHHLELTQAAFADRFGVPLRTYIGWEHDRADPSARLLADLHDIGIDVGWLVRGPGDAVQYREQSFDWPRLKQLHIRVAAVAKAAKFPIRPDQLADYVQTIFLNRPEDDEKALQRLADVLGPLGRKK